ncbi:zinc finger protein 233-like [Argiope bruennichi]|uniref:zinc finger protein 233-like n=1 Tax=Argiope bruennichi TaxID=94029 RepID=UPI002494402E|nr:zinc finger protein 233-like [Argiope bruennichi]
MDQYRCKRCGNIVARGEDHPCYFYKKFDYKHSTQVPVESEKSDDEVKEKSTEYSNDRSRYLNRAAGQIGSKKSELMNLSLFQNNEKDKSLSSTENRRKTSADSSNNAQIWNPHNVLYFNPISDVQGIEVQSDINASSGKVKSDYRPENHKHESYEKEIFVTGESGVDIQKQRVSALSDLIRATTEESQMRLETSKWQSLNNDEYNFIYFLESVINKAISDCKNISGTMNLISNPDLPSGSNEPKNCKMQVSEGETNGHISPEVHSQGHSKKKKMAVYVKEPNSTKKDDNAVAAPSGMCPREKKYSCSLCFKEFNNRQNLTRHYRSHTGKTPYVCDICGKKFDQKSDRDRHYRIHTGEKPYVCDICEKKFNQISSRNTHYRTHTGDRPFVCDVCNEGFTHKSNLTRHKYRKHTAERNGF